jgi:uroporphyrinogen III methyltransferase/synthase
MSAQLGKVFLVGAGPGDPGLLTLRGAECLRIADVVLYDYLASAELLEFARPGAELMCLGRHGRGRLMSQVEVNRAMIAHARRGRTVVRLKGGDPTIFARMAEELAALEAAGVAYEIVPGITAAQSASSHAAIPLTERDEASCVAFVTGHESADKQSAPSLDYGALVTFPGTLVFYMGVTTARQWSAALLKHGKPPDTPVAIVRHVSLPDQQTLLTTLSELADVVRTKKLRPPAVLIVGEVARERAVANWFTSRPLLGRTVLETRPRHQADELANELRNLGARVLRQPAIEISDPDDWAPVDIVIRGLDEFDWLVFSSSNGVHYFLRRLVALGYDLRRLGGRKIAAIGPATAAALADYHLSADAQPSEFRAEALAEKLATQARGRRVFLARASRGRDVLAEMLIAAGAKVDQAVVYESRDVGAPGDEVVEALFAGQIDWTTVTSSAIARSLVRMFGDALKKTKLAAISPLTAEVLTELGHAPAVVANDYTVAGIVACILSAEARKV